MSGLGHSPRAGVHYSYMRFEDRYQSPPATSASAPHAPYNSYYSPSRAASTQSPHRSANRPYFRTASANVTPVYGQEFSHRPPTTSPRYDSEGRYATANVSDGFSSRNYPPYNPSSPLPPSSHSRRPVFIPTRNSTPSGESDEELITRDGNIAYRTASPGRYRRSEYYNLGNPTMYGGIGTRPDFHGVPRRRNSFGEEFREHATDRVFSQTGPYNPMQDVFDKHSPRCPHDIPSRPSTSSRRPSMTTPQRPATTAPRSSHKKAATSTSSPSSTKIRQATEKDARQHSIPEGFSLKNWDPSQVPILLLGSVFDANSLGKWIYDWTIHTYTASSEQADIAGRLWLCLIQLYGKVRDGDQVVERIRSKDNQDIVFEFLDSGDRLQDRLRKILKVCEDPMLRVAEKGRSHSLGQSSGKEFVKTLLVTDRDVTEKYIQNVNIFLQRWECNVKPILNNPIA